MLAAALLAAASCASGSPGASTTIGERDLAIGPLVLIGGRRWGRARRDAFDGHGYKIPATLPDGATATLSVPRALHGHVGLVYSQAAQARVFDRGVRGADSSVRFTACPAGSVSGRTGWGGGLVVDRPRCATLVVRVPGERPVRRRVPLGRRCSNQ